ncbi:DUF1778 domain-containing protein [Leifsonia sp. NPDC077715]|uniref:type II toxin-antitoxin system TacA family antitoxin n=1 Tax=Leifsonia sp. NPDC077715 TaxID=3155539 RepID=UPI00341F2C9F
MTAPEHAPGPEDYEIRPLGSSDDRKATAAELQQQDLTSFILGPALEHARSILLQDTLIRLTPTEVDQLEQALEEPGVVSEPLAALVRHVREARGRV